MSPRSTGRHRSDASPSTPLSVLADSVKDGLNQATAMSARNGAALAVTTGLVATMGLPAAASDTSASGRAVTPSVALAQSVPADVVSAAVSAPKAAVVRFERTAFTAAPAKRGKHRADDVDTGGAAAGIVRTSRALARAAYQAQQPAPAERAQPGRVSRSTPRGSCSKSTSIEAHLTSNARAVYRAVCALFGGSVSSFGGHRPGDGGDHGSGRAVDIMVSGNPGWEIARYLQANARELGVTYVIYEQKIWLAGNPTSQWKFMEDRGSRTANHYDHVHVSVK